MAVMRERGRGAAAGAAYTNHTTAACRTRILGDLQFKSDSAIFFKELSTVMKPLCGSIIEIYWSEVPGVFINTVLATSAQRSAGGGGSGRRRFMRALPLLDSILTNTGIVLRLLPMALGFGFRRTLDPCRVCTVVILMVISCNITFYDGIFLLFKLNHW